MVIVKGQKVFREETKRWITIGGKLFYKLGYDKKYPELLIKPTSPPEALFWNVKYSNSTTNITVTKSDNTFSYTGPIKEFVGKIPIGSYWPHRDCVLFNMDQSQTIFTKDQVEFVYNKVTKLVLDEFYTSRTWKFVHFSETFKLVSFVSNDGVTKTFALQDFLTNLEKYKYWFQLTLETIEQIQGKQGNLLTQYNIHSRSDFRKWSLRNHPDKGGDTALFQKISNLVDQVY